MSRPKILLYLHHVELGQRYPISDQEVVIGRSVGHILFAKDDRLSQQHFRIYRDADGRMCVQDLGSSSGTVVDGRLMSPQKSYPVRDGTVIAAGQQIFKCVEPANAQQLQFKPRKKRKKKSAGPDFSMFFMLVIILGFGYLGWEYQHVFYPKIKEAIVLPQVIASPFEIVYPEMEDAYEQYRQMGRSFQHGKLSNKDLAAEIRRTLIPKFMAVQAKVAVVKPTSEFERRKIEANKKLIDALLAQVTAMAKFSETNDPKYSAEIDKIRSSLDEISEDARRLNEQRLPASQ